MHLIDGTEAQNHESTDQTSDCNAGEEQTPLKMCSVKLEDCSNLIESREEETPAEEQQQSHEEEQDNDWIDDDKEETKAQDSVWSVRDQRFRDTQDSKYSLTLLCYTDAQDHESTDQTSDCNAGEQQTPLKMCSVKLEDCRNLIESREEETTAEQQQQSHEEEDDDEDQNKDDDDDGDFVPSGMFLPFMARCAKLTELSVKILCMYRPKIKWSRISCEFCQFETLRTTHHELHMLPDWVNCFPAGWF